MSWLSTLHDEARSYWTGPYSLKDPALVNLWGTGRRTDAGITVTDELAMMCSAVFDAVNILSSDIAKIPLDLRKRLENGGSEPYIGSKVYYLLKRQPNPEMGAMTFRQTLMAHALTLGGGYAEIVRDGLGRPSALWPITPDRICRKTDDRTGRTFYLVDQKEKFAPENILHIKPLGWDGLTGYSILNQARQALGLALAMEKFSSAFFGNGSTFGGVLSTDSLLADPEEKNGIREEIEKMHGGVDRAFRLMVLGQGFKFEPFGINAKDSDLSALRDKQVEEVSRFYRLPLHKLNNLTRATFSNVEQQDLEYYKGPVLDWVKTWEEECDIKLIPQLESRLFFFKHNVNAFLRGDSVSRAQFYAVMRDKGIYNANEIREFEDLNPQPGEQGNTYFMQAAQMPQDKLLEKAQADIDKVKAETDQIENPPESPAPTPSPSNNMDEGAMRAIAARLEAAEKLAHEYRDQIAAAIEARATAEGAKSVTEAEVSVLRAQAEAAEMAVVTITADRDAMLAERDALQTTLSAREAATAQAEADARAATEARETADAHLAAVRAELAETRETAAQLTVELTDLREKMGADTETRAAAAEALDEAEIRILEAQAQIVKLAAQVAETATRATEAQTRETEALAQVVAAKRAAHTQAADQQARELDAHRSLYLHVMRGAIERETDRARRAQQTPEKLKAWIESWYDSHAELMRAALLPAIHIHLAWIGSTEDAGDLARELVADHVATSRRQLAAVVQGDASALAGSLASLLQRWESERINTIPAKLLEREVAYVRSRE